MSRRDAIVPLLLLSFLTPLPACDPEYHLCVVATSCASALPIAEAHVMIEAYAVDGNTDSTGKICHEESLPRSHSD